MKSLLIQAAFRFAARAVLVVSNHADTSGQLKRT